MTASFPAQLGAAARRRLEALRAAGGHVHGPVPAEDTAGHPTADDSERPEGQGWVCVIRLSAPDGSEQAYDGRGPTPDAAAESALVQIPETAEGS
jgi:hypothetical protein